MTLIKCTFCRGGVAMTLIKCTICRKRFECCSSVSINLIHRRVLKI